MTNKFEKIVYESMDKNTTVLIAYGKAECGHKFVIKTKYDNNFINENKEYVEMFAKNAITEGVGDCPMCVRK